ncbi:sugar transferase, PEP-CTERM/EpsH1 system associated [Lishizhenia tianjinensis]|uniref:Sugar transferase, PEP-CTERM/EpsH1 system associated n=1 Tax=Lishizhenia tianjinensis TaxID=477690 RepID=A0A1I6YXE2_9FLAO|nr:sugar transferase, PEP-CTERM/EpsH1 system associated [Lishizhenia tianjinensis]
MNSSATHKEKLVVLTSRFPYPLEKGDKLRAYYQMIELAKVYDIHLLALTEIELKDEWIKEVEKYCKAIHVFKLNKVQKLFGTALQLLTNKPFQVGYFTNYGVKKQINQLLKAIEPDHIYCQLVRPAEYVKNYHACPKTIDYMDALSKGIHRRIALAPWYKRPFFKAEYQRLRNYEHKIFDYFEHHSIITAQDREMIFHKDRNEIAIIPNGVSPSFFNFQHKEEPTKDLVFTGNLSYPPNIEASLYLGQHIMPALPKLSLQISGANPVQEIKALENKQIEVTGWVDDIRTAYASAKIFVAPMFIGTGLQNKLLEAMAMGLPCITTTLANNALGAKDKHSILIANTEAEFIAAVETLLTDNTLYQHIQGNARTFVNNNFNWHSSSMRLIDLMKS